MNCLEFVLGIIVVCVVLYINDHKYEYMTTEKMSRLDQRLYKVVGSFEDNHAAADRLAEMHKFIVDFLRYIKNKFIVAQQGTTRQREFVSRILTNYNPDVIFENDPGPGEETSFVTNKGEQFGICLREKVGSARKKIHDINILKFVMLHELSHLGTLTYGHNIEFWSSFKFVLIQAAESGLYNPVDYSKEEINYCGLDVQFNPYFSNSYMSI